MKNKKTTNKQNEWKFLLPSLFLIGFFGAALLFSSGDTSIFLLLLGLTLLGLGLFCQSAQPPPGIWLGISGLTAAVWTALPFLTKLTASWQDFTGFLPVLLLLYGLKPKQQGTFSKKTKKSTGTARSHSAPKQRPIQKAKAGHYKKNA